MRRNTVETWNRPFLFAPICLRQPRRSRHAISLSSLVKQQLQEELACTTAVAPAARRRRHARKNPDPEMVLARRVAAMIEDGDFRGAIRLATSDDTLADFSDDTFNALCAKHPPAHPDSHIPPSPTGGKLVECEVSCMDVVQAIRSFPCGSAGGPDKLRPQHLKDLLQHVQHMGDEDPESPLLSALADFCNLVLRGDTPEEVRPFLFGASLVALRKKGGGVRPIAVGCTLRRLVAKVACKQVVDEMAELLAPRQLGYGVRGGSEAAVHAARRFLNNMGTCQAMVKLDFENAFNSVRRDCMLEAVQLLCPPLYAFAHSAYAAPSNLFWDDNTFSSAEDVQQGDPLGPLFFCLLLHQHSLQLKSEFQALYLDDATLAGNCQYLVHDIQVIREAVDLGLTLNAGKCEIISSDMTICGTLLVSLPGVQLVPPSRAQLLGSPIGDDSCVSAVLAEKVETLRRLGERLKLLSAHDALILLRNCFALPKLLHTLRTAPCFSSATLATYDDCLCEIPGLVTNTLLERDSLAWMQAALPVKLGGLGIRSAVSVAPSAFLASTHSTAELVDAILPPRIRFHPAPHLDEAQSRWSAGHDCQPPKGIAACRQKSWDYARTSLTAQRLLDEAENDEERSRLLAVSTRESGAWLRALPVSALGLRMDDDTVRVAVGLRLGAPVCGPHRCQHCSAEVNALGRHALSCRWSEGRHLQHAALNEIVKRGLTAAHVPSRLEPTGLLRSDGKRPDGVTLAPWQAGRLLVWDATYPDTFATSYRTHATQEAGKVAENAEDRKTEKYRGLPASHSFTPITIETMGAIGPRSMAFLKALGRRIATESGEPRLTDFLLQRLSVAVQRGNCASVRGA